MSAAFLNFSFSKASRTKALTTRMALTFSCTLAFRSSYLRNTWSKMRVVRSMIKTSAAASTTMAARKIRLSRTLMKKHMNIEQTSISGARTAMRRIMVVMRVTSPAVENLSMFENEKVCTLQYMASRRLQAYPADALAENRPASTPKHRLNKASASISRP